MYGRNAIRFPAAFAVRGFPNACGTPFAQAASEFLKSAFAGPADQACSDQSCTAEGGACELPTHRLAIDVHEETRDGATAWVITANVPGFRKDEVGIEVKDGVLTIEANRSRTTESTDTAATGAKTTVYRKERRTANYVRQIRLPENASDSGITAALADGVLTVTVPQLPEAQPRKVSIA